MESFAPTPEALVRPWRRATVVATAVAAVELVLLVAAGIALLAPRLAHHARLAATARQPAAHRPPVVSAQSSRAELAASPKLSPAQTSVLVLNGNGRPGAAGMEANLARARGYRIARVGNAGRTDYTHSLVMYRPGFRGDAVRFAHELGISEVAPLDGLTPAGLGRAQLAIVVGAG